MTYTIERVNTYSKELLDFLDREMPKINVMFGGKYDFANRDEDLFIDEGCFLVCKRDDVITGFHVSFMTLSPFDENVKVFQQQIFYVQKDSGRSAYHLFKKFIDIGRQEANHIITMLTSQTNIKPETLKSWGFKELETLYRIEV